MDEPAEKKLLADCRDRIRKESGKAPLGWLSPWIAGGLRVNTIASFTRDSSASARATSACALFCSPFRSSHGLSRTKAIAFACPCP